MFRKPKRNVRQRQVESDEEERVNDDEENSITEIQSKIEKIKKKKDAKKLNKSSSAGGQQDQSNVETKSSLLSFDNFDAEADDGVVFRVKKSSQSRKLMKQIKAERKQRERFRDDPGNPPLPATPPPPGPPGPPPPPTISKPEIDDFEDIGIKLKSNLVVNKIEQPRTLAGYEAEALHLEEEDQSEDSEEDQDDSAKKDPLQEILQRGDIPDAAAIFAARKMRQAAREKGGRNQANQDFYSLKNKEAKDDKSSKASMHARDDDDDSEDDENRKIVMTGTRSNSEIMKESLKKADTKEIDVDHHRWEEQQIRKAMGPALKPSMSPEMHTNYEMVESSKNGHFDRNNGHFMHEMSQLKSYDLDGIKDRLKSRISNLTETYRAHCNEADKIVDDVLFSQTTIEEKEAKLPGCVQKHQFYQDLRGYLTDLVECFNEKVTQIKFVQEKHHKLKADTLAKLVERRREDVRDQMRELSSSLSNKPLQITAEENNEEWARQRRAAEREGRRRRRAQLR